MKGVLFLAICIILTMNSVFAAHYVFGQVNDAYDGTSANGKTAVLWNPSIGISDNITDTIGQSGSSGADNFYLFDCELLSNGCNIGDELRIKVFSNTYPTQEANVTISGAGFDAASEIRINSLPNSTLISPINYANLSSSSINLICNATDQDYNLANITLYGSWNFWHLNETKKITGGNNQTIFNKNIYEGNHNWSCLATDNLSISSFSQNYTFTLDLTSPNISSISYNVSDNLCSEAIARVNCTTSDNLSGINFVTLMAITPTTTLNYSTQLISSNTYYADININETGTWTFTCFSYDFAGNFITMNSSDLLLSSLPDLRVSGVFFNNQSNVENDTVEIIAQIDNLGCSGTNNFTISFYENSIHSQNTLRNTSLALIANDKKNTSIYWNSKIGNTTIFVLADSNNSVIEPLEFNNQGNNTFTQHSWQEFYGTINLDKILAGSSLKNLSIWFNESTFTGNVFITDSELSVNWAYLEAIGKNISGSNSTNDLYEIDILLNTTNFTDSVSAAYKSTFNKNLSIFKNNITSILSINSTNNTNFFTGILWDKSDDTNSEFDILDQEDLVFVTKVNQNASGMYGIYDYEINIPVRLRQYSQIDNKEVIFYYDLN